MATDFASLDQTAGLRDAIRFAGPSARAMLRHGFELLESFPDYPEVLAAIQQTFSGRSPASSKPDGMGEIAKRDWGAIVSAGALLVVAVAIKKEKPADVEAEIQKSELVERVGPGLRRFMDGVQDQAPTLRGSWERAQLVSEVLPALTRVETTVDMRFGFSGDEVDYCAPILLVHLDSDAYGQEMWFQLTRPQLEGFIADMQKALARMNAIEAWKQD